MLELRGFEHKFLPPYSPFFNGIECMFSEWKHYVKVGLQGHRARDEEDLQANRMKNPVLYVRFNFGLRLKVSIC